MSYGNCKYLFETIAERFRIARRIVSERFIDVCNVVVDSRVYRYLAIAILTPRNEVLGVNVVAEIRVGICSN